MNMYDLCWVCNNRRTTNEFSKESLTRLRQSGDWKTRIIEGSLCKKVVFNNQIIQTCARFAERQ